MESVFQQVNLVHLHLFGCHVLLFCIFYLTSFFTLLHFLLPFLHIKSALYHSLLPYIKLYGYSCCHLQVPSETFLKTKSRLLPCVDLGQPAGGSLAQVLLSRLGPSSCLLGMSQQIVHSPRQWSAEAFPPFFNPWIPALVCLLHLSLSLALQELKSWLPLPVSRPRFHQDRGFGPNYCALSFCYISGP